MEFTTEAICRLGAPQQIDTSPNMDQSSSVCMFNIGCHVRGNIEVSNNPVLHDTQNVADVKREKAFFMGESEALSKM